MQFSLFVTKAKQQVGGKNQIDKVPQFSVSLKKKKKWTAKKVVCIRHVPVVFQNRLVTGEIREIININSFD